MKKLTDTGDTIIDSTGNQDEVIPSNEDLVNHDLPISPIADTTVNQGQCKFVNHVPYSRLNL